MKPDDSTIFLDANNYLEQLSQSEYGAKLLLRLGGGEESGFTESDLGHVTIHKRNLQESFLLDIQFPDSQYLRQCHDFFESYAKHIDTFNGAVNPERILSLILMEDSDQVEGYLVGQIPVFFAPISSIVFGPIYTYRIAFRKDCLFYFSVSDFVDEDEYDDLPLDSSESENTEASWFLY